jgi:acyl-[acyl-carrier-protein] desaturase
MPGKLMDDGKDPDLFEHFSNVAQRIGIYTIFDYASIVRHLVNTWKVPTLALAGNAAAAQEWLCGHAEQVESNGERATAEAAKQPPAKFSWIHDRTV